MTDRFDDAVAIVLREEGAHSDHPADPGGDTWYGLARRFNLDLEWPPTRDQAVAVYRARYWDACRCGELPWLLALPLFDGAVNHGDMTARVLMQTAAGVRGDGTFGPVTMATLQAPTTDRGRVLDRFCALRGVQYGRNLRFAVFGGGWMNRLMRVHRLALAS